MANFTTHIAVGTVVSGACATLTLAANVIAPENLVGVTMAGVLGSVLPDIDLKDSRPSKALFSGLAIFFSFAVLFAVAYKYSIAEMWLMWLGTLVAVRYGLKYIFHQFSYHRGIWHSILAGLLFWFLTAIVFHYVLGRHEGVGWLAGGFLFVGYMTHLILDEIYSVDVMDTRIKASFGTALKLYDGKRMLDTAAVAAMTVAAFLFTPAPNVFVEGITSQTLWSGLQQRMLPQDGRPWFNIGTRLPAFARPQKAAVSTIETGSVKAAGTAATATVTSVPTAAPSAAPAKAD